MDERVRVAVECIFGGGCGGEEIRSSMGKVGKVRSK